MALFRRKKNESVMPEEVRNFYASEQRDRKGMAWVLAVATLLVTFVIAALLFFGGRWVYRTVFDNNDNSTTSQKGTEDEATSSDTAKSADNSSSKSNSFNNSSSVGNNSGSTSQAKPGSTGTSSLNTTQTTPSTGPDELVDTGPGDENW